jgi:hypothetical protein
MPTLARSTTIGTALGVGPGDGDAGGDPAGEAPGNGDDDGDAAVDAGTGDGPSNAGADGAGGGTGGDGAGGGDACGTPCGEAGRAGAAAACGSFDVRARAGPATSVRTSVPSVKHAIATARRRTGISAIFRPPAMREASSQTSVPFYSFRCSGPARESDVTIS